MVVDCNGCGASLPIDGETRFVTCAKCAARLEVLRAGSSIRTAARAKAVERKGDDDSSAVEASTARTDAGGEWALRLVIGLGLVGSDLFWWMTDPTLHATPVRVVLLLAGAVLFLSGLHNLAKRLRAQA